MGSYGMIPCKLTNPPVGGNHPHSTSARRRSGGFLYWEHVALLVVSPTSTDVSINLLFLK